MSPGENWYVYYPAPADCGSALPLLRTMQQDLVQQCGIRARVEERVGDAAPTWMEVYEGVIDPDGFKSALQTAVAAAGLNGLAALRRIERFRRL